VGLQVTFQAMQDDDQGTMITLGPFKVDEVAIRKFQPFFRKRDRESFSEQTWENGLEMPV